MHNTTLTIPEIIARAHTGLTYADYRARWQAQMQEPMKGLDKTVRKYRHYARYNDARSLIVESEYTPSAQAVEALQAIEAPQLWMVLTEDWCGDSAYNLPVLAALAEAAPSVTLRILPRDSHLDVMDLYLTGTSRSIPKLVAFGADGHELFQWGPRPKAVLEQRASWEAEGASKPEMSKLGVEWYDAGGWQHLEAEVLDRLVEVQPVRV